MGPMTSSFFFLPFFSWVRPEGHGSGQEATSLQLFIKVGTGLEPTPSPRPASSLTPTCAFLTTAVGAN